MASAGTAPAASAVKNRGGSAMFADKLPEEINDMKIKDEKVGYLLLNYCFSVFFYIYICMYICL